MARDLLFGNTRRSWSRGGCSRPATLTFLKTTSVSDEVTVKLTPPEMAMLAELSATKMRADLGDRRAQKQVAVTIKKLAKLRAKANKGDAAAKRTLLVLNESGVFRGSQSFTMGSLTRGDEAQVPNVAYRAAVLKQAIKTARGKKPSTKDFFKAKSAVDRVMADAGVSLYLPGSRPGRITA